MRRASGYGSGFKRTALVAENMVVVAPMPRVRTMTAAKVKPRLCSNMRTAKRRSEIMPNAKCQMPNAKCRMSNVECRKEFQTEPVVRRNFCVPCDHSARLSNDLGRHSKCTADHYGETIRHPGTRLPLRV